MTEPDRPDDEDTGPGTLALWFWGSLLAFGLFLVVVPGTDPAGRFWLWFGVALLVASVVGLGLAVLARVRDRVRDRNRPPARDRSVGGQ